ncbi:SGNH/GDSL hydrolase family protein [Flavobacterium sp. Arc2]|uniref:SGNH/GDSL hydrolase family protein n=1 Tax=Flavobacterium sp. Arc2 TaxID=3046685 RepID=UPI00352C49AF
MKNFNSLFAILLLTFFMTQKLKAQDWPNLNKYQKENLALSTPTVGQNRVVFMGDSITEFWSTVDGTYFQGKPYVNRGISGQTTPQMLIRFRADVIDLKPSVVVILAGINDIAGNTGPATLDMITNNIFSMVELAKAHKIKVVLCSVLPAFDFPWKPNQQPADKITALNEILINYADTNNLVYLDYYATMVDERKGLQAEYSEDGVHPNKRGYQVMEPFADNAIALALSMK